MRTYQLDERNEIKNKLKGRAIEKKTAQENRLSQIEKKASPGFYRVKKILNETDKLINSENREAPLYIRVWKTVPYEEC
jgi:hypothetical protein